MSPSHARDQARSILDLFADFHPTLLERPITDFSGLESEASSFCQVAPRSTEAACHTVYNNKGIIYRSSIPPVDMSFPFSQTLPEKFGAGATMVYQEGSTFCPELENTGSVSSNPF